MSDIYPIAVPKWGIEMVEGTITTGPGCEQAAEVLNAMNQPPG